MRMKSKIFVTCTAILVIVFLFMYTQKKFSYQREYFASAKEPTIFVSIASYRDDSCNTTISNMIRNAKFPYRISFGICEQHKPGDAPCVVHDKIAREFPDFPLEHIRILKLESSDAKGPMYARRLCRKMYRDEDFYLQIDSHMHFASNWDQILVDQMKSLPEKSVLSTYPLEHGDKNLVTNAEIPVFRKPEKGKNGLPIFKSKKIQNPGTFQRTVCTAGGFCLLSKSATSLELWPYLPNLFQGEESILAAMLFTNGFDVFCPIVNVVTHKYGRKSENKFWDDKPEEFWEIQKRSEKSARRLLCLDFPIIEPGSDKISLGTVRDVDSFWKNVYM